MIEKNLQTTNNKTRPLAKAKKKTEQSEDISNIANRKLTGGLLSEAIHDYKEAVYQDEKNVKNRINLGDAYLFSEMPTQAMEQYRKAQKSSPKSPEPYAGLADVYKRYGKWSAAIAQYRKAIDIEPFNAFYRYKLAESLWLASAKEEAFQASADAARINPNDPFYHFQHAEMSLNLNHLETALDEYAHACLLSPEDSYYFLRWGIACIKARSYKKAETVLLKALRLDNQNAVIPALLTTIYRSLGDVERYDYYNQYADVLDSYDKETLSRLLHEAGVEKKEI